MSKSSNCAISITNLSKRYVIGKKKDGSLRGSLANLFKTKKTKENEFWALKDINFEIEKGDVIGIIGRNGAGKSTLLKVLSQITQPTTGRIEINGRIASLLEVGTGFHPELTGRENIFLNGTILGMTRKEVQSKFDEIVNFSGVEKFIDTPVKHYSSGMYVRLAFSVAAHLEPEILIIDEVLAVGDIEFQQKCIGKMKDVASEGRTVIFVSHHLGSVSTLCNKCILLKEGEVIKQGPTKDVIDAYLSLSIKPKIYQFEEIDSDVFFSKIYTCDQNGELLDRFAHSQDIKIRCEIVVKSLRSNQNLEICLQVKDKSRLFTVNKKLTELNRENLGRIVTEFTIKGGLIAPNSYSFYCGLNSGTCTPDYHHLEDICPIKVYDDGTELASIEGLDYGSILVPNTWEVINTKMKNNE